MAFVLWGKMQEEFEDINGGRIHKSKKYIHHNDKKKKEKRHKQRFTKHYT
jgi:hypothetical protein